MLGGNFFMAAKKVWFRCRAPRAHSVSAAARKIHQACSARPGGRPRTGLRSFFLGGER